MKKILALASILLIAHVLNSQEFSRKYLGINVLQIPALTINLNYTNEIKPYFSSHIDMGYTPNYINAETTDMIGYFLTMHCDCMNDGYILDTQKGGYVKLGGYLNLRNQYEKRNYFLFGAFITNSIIYESGYKTVALDVSPYHIEQDIKHTKFIIGLSLSSGYTFKISNRIQSDINFQISLPNKNYKDLYGYSNYIPGMGAKDFSSYWFPMLIWNIKYRL